MALATGQYRSGGGVFDAEGRRVKRIMAGGAPLEAGMYRSGGKVFDSDGREVIIGADASSDPTSLYAWHPSQNKLLSANFDPAIAGTNLTITNGLAFFATVPWPSQRTVGNVWYRANAGHGGSGVDHRVVVCQLDGTRVAEVDVTTANASAGPKKVALSMPNLASPTGYLVVGMYAATAGTLALRAGNDSAAVGLAIGTDVLRGFSKALASGPQASMNFLTTGDGALAVTHLPWFGLAT